MELLQVDIDEMKEHLQTLEARSKSSDLLWKVDLQMR